MRDVAPPGRPDDVLRVEGPRAGVRSRGPDAGRLALHRHRSRSSMPSRASSPSTPRGYGAPSMASPSTPSLAVTTAAGSRRKWSGRSRVRRGASGGELHAPRRAHLSALSRRSSVAGRRPAVDARREARRRRHRSVRDRSGFRRFASASWPFGSTNPSGATASGAGSSGTPSAPRRARAHGRSRRRRVCALLSSATASVHPATSRRPTLSVLVLTPE